MPKIKTHSGAKKRFALTKNGKVKRAHAGKRHLLNGHGKTTKLKRALRNCRQPDKTTQAANQCLILPQYATAPEHTLLQCHHPR